VKKTIKIRVEEEVDVCDRCDRDKRAVTRYEHKLDPIEAPQPTPEPIVMLLCVDCVKVIKNALSVRPNRRKQK